MTQGRFMKNKAALTVFGQLTGLGGELLIDWHLPKLLLLALASAKSTQDNYMCAALGVPITFIPEFGLEQKSVVNAQSYHCCLITMFSTKQQNSNLLSNLMVGQNCNLV